MRPNNELDQRVLGVPLWLHLAFFPFPVFIVGWLSVLWLCVKGIRWLF